MDLTGVDGQDINRNGDGQELHGKEGQGGGGGSDNREWGQARGMGSEEQGLTLNILEPWATEAWLLKAAAMAS